MANTLKFGDGKWATGEGTALAFNDENDNFKPLPFTFTRNSTATVVNESGLIEEVGNDVPRIDFKDNTKGALLLEPQRTNDATYSEDIGSWAQPYTPTITSNIAVAPDGTTTADGLQSTSTSNYQYINKVISVTANSTYTASLFVKKETTETAYMGIGLVFTGGTTDVGYGIIDTVNGTGYSADPRIPLTIVVDDYGDYWRFAFTGTDSGSNTTLNYSIYGTLSLNGTTVAVGSGSVRTIWGAQLEVGSYATSYIPTEGSAVTRVADSCSQTFPDGVIGQTEGTMYAEVDISNIESVGGFSAFRIYDGTSSNSISFIMYPNGRIQITAFNGGSLVVNINDNNYGLTSGIHKIAVAYKLNDYIIYVDGSVVGSDTSATVPATNKFDLYYTSIGSLKYNQTKLYNTRLSNSELATLTQV